MRHSIGVTRGFRGSRCRPQVHPQGDKKIFLRNFVGIGVNLVRCTPLCEIKLSKLSIICIYKHEEGHQILMKNGEHPPRENPGYAYASQTVVHVVYSLSGLRKDRRRETNSFFWE